MLKRLRTRPAAWLRSLQHGRRANVGIEFALIGPIMIVFVIGIYDTARGMILYQEVENAAHTIPLSASIVAIQPNQTTSLTAAQVQQAMSIVYAEMPWVRSGAVTGTRSVTMSSVVFLKTVATCNPLTTTCAYTPTVVWSVAYASNNGTGFTNVTRPCGSLTQTAPNAGASSNLSNLRTANVVNPDPILVVDVHFQYTPTFFTFISGPLDFWSSGYWPVRTAPPNTPTAQQYTTYDTANVMGGAGKCPGYT